MIYEDDYGNTYEDDYSDIKDAEQFYRCPNPRCGWIGTTKEMRTDADCGDEYDAVYSDYCCPKCLTFLFLDWWKKVRKIM